MTDNNGDSARTSSDGGSARRPSAIIDVKATSIDNDSPPRDASADAAEPAADLSLGGRQEGAASDVPEGPSTATNESGSADADGGPGMPRPHRRPALISLLTHLAAGLAGGIVVLAAANMFAPQTGPTQESANRAVQDIDRRLRAIETSVAAQSSGPSPEFTQKLAAAEQRLARLADIGRNLTQISESQAKLAKDAKALEDRLGKLGTVEDAQARLSKLEAKLEVFSAAAQSREGGGAERINREIADVKAATARLAQRVEVLQASDDRLAPALRSLQEETASLKGEFARELKSVARTQDVSRSLAPVSGRVSALEEGVESLAKSERDRNANAERIVLALELGNLKRVVERGVPYPNELAEVSKVSSGRLNLSVLERYKAQGVPAVTELAREFRGLTHAIIDAESEQPDASILDRMLAGAKSIVRVRRVSHAAGDNSVEAVVARMERSVNDGNLALVIEEAKHLSPKAMAPARSWLEKVEARAAVERAIADIDAALKASLGAGTQADRRG
jgi:chromosome segregation ATPase